MEHDLIALFDMDGTLFDWKGRLKKDLASIRSPGELEVEFDFQNVPTYLQERINLITSSESWWENLPKFQLGWDILNVAIKLDYKIHILTQGPRKNPAAWSGKKKCIDKHFGEEFNLTLTRDKGLVYGKVLVDDFQGYIERWLKWRERGQVIMPASNSNEGFSHPQVLRYDGKNLYEVQEILKGIKKTQKNV